MNKLPFYLRPGMKVALKALPHTNISREIGVYDGNAGRGLACVTLLPEHRDGRSDDGLREVAYDQLEKFTA